MVETPDGDFPLTNYCSISIPDALCEANQRQVALPTGNVACIGIVDIPPLINGPFLPTSSMPGASENGIGELFGLAKASDPDSQGMCSTFGNPVNTSTGNKVQQEVDYVGGGRLPIVVSRTYNSHGAFDYGTLGKKWTLGLPELRIWHASPIDVIDLGFINIRADGQRIRIRRHESPDGGTFYYTRENGRPLRVIGSANGEWSILDGTIEERYDNLGRIKLIIDHSHGEYLKYTFTG
ncbi:MAG: DUF6531 domain-containing protein, partial [Pseudomonadota bacterium]